MPLCQDRTASGRRAITWASAAMRGRLFAAFASLMTATFVAIYAAPAAAQETAPGGGEAPAVQTCESCHADETVLPGTHPSIEGMTMEECSACHAPGGEMALPPGMHLDHHHYLAGLDCASCHEDTEAPAEPPTEVCLACHGTLEEIGKLTADVEPANPHDSPHGPPYAECALCHVEHAPSEDFCAQCHDFGFTVP